MPGNSVDIPAQEDQYSYFTTQPADRAVIVAEVVAVIHAHAATGDGRRSAAKSMQSPVAEWEKLWELSWKP
jgi:hypothetical protein